MRMPPASRVARRPSRSSAAMRPSQPPDRLRARSPSCHVRGSASAGSGARRLEGGQPLGDGLGPGDRRVQADGRDRLALERPAGRGQLGAQVVDDPVGLGPRRADGLVALAPGAPTLLLGRAQGLGRARPRRRGRARAPRSSRPRSRVIDARVASNERCASVSRERASSTMASGRPSRSAMANAWLPPGSPMVRRYVGVSVSRSNSTAALRAPDVVWAYALSSA